jgi:25S rRNA (uracil2634-N3)-methyltransferase
MLERVHTVLAEHRVRPEREYFAIEFELAKGTINDIRQGNTKTHDAEKLTQPMSAQHHHAQSGEEDAIQPMVPLSLLLTQDLKRPSDQTVKCLTCHKHIAPPIGAHKRMKPLLIGNKALTSSDDETHQDGPICDICSLTVYACTGIAVDANAKINIPAVHRDASEVAEPADTDHNRHFAPEMHTNGISQILSILRKSLLSIGSGDASQQVAMLQSGIRNLTVSFYDTEAQLCAKYPCAKANLETLRSGLGAERLLFSVDATRLCSTLGSFDIVFFYFPHTGVTGSGDAVRISNQALLRGFFGSVHNVLNPSGEVQVALSTSQFYLSWDLKSLVPSGMALVGEDPVDKGQFPGYVHRLTKGMAGPMKHVKEKCPKVFILGQGGEPSLESQEVARVTVQVWLTARKGLGFAREECQRFVVHYLRSSDVPLTAMQIYSMFPCELREDLGFGTAHVPSITKVLRGMVHAGTLSKGPVGKEPTACIAFRQVAEETAATQP